MSQQPVPPSAAKSVSAARGRRGLSESIGTAADIVDQRHRLVVTERDAERIGQQIRRLREVRRRGQLADPPRRRPRDPMPPAAELGICGSAAMTTVVAVTLPSRHGKLAKRHQRREAPLTAVRHHATAAPRRRGLIGNLRSGWFQGHPPSPLSHPANLFIHVRRRPQHLPALDPDLSTIHRDPKRNPHRMPPWVRMVPHRADSHIPPRVSMCSPTRLSIHDHTRPQASAASNRAFPRGMRYDALDWFVTSHQALGHVGRDTRGDGDRRGGG